VAPAFGNPQAYRPTVAPSDALPFVPGSREDFDRLYRQAYPGLLRTAYAVLGDPSSAEDCVQDAFLRAFEAWPRFRPERPPMAWLQQITVNVAISYRRRRRLRAVAELVRRLGRPQPPPDPATLAEGAALVATLAALPPKLSAAFVMRHYHGFTNREIAAILRVSERTVGARLSAARRQLRDRLGQEWSELPDSGSSRVDRRVGADA
jgi:RNA polymerase sigma-70 factor (ECF subfamily)